MAEREYRRLTRAGIRRQGWLSAFHVRSSLWLGRDHVLCVDSTGYTEDYKRFFFRDIQAITLRQTRRWLIWTWVLIGPAILCLAGLITSLWPSPADKLGARIAWSIFSALFVIPLLLNLLAGPSCICHLRTLVQTEELPPLNRLRRARKVLARLRPLIAAEQGQLTPEEVPLRMQELLAGTAGVTASPPAAAPAAEPAPEAPPRIET